MYPELQLMLAHDLGGVIVENPEIVHELIAIVRAEIVGIPKANILDIGKPDLVKRVRQAENVVILRGTVAGIAGMNRVSS